MADSIEPTDEQIAVCDVIWECYKTLGTDDLSGPTYDRNEFYHTLLVLNRLAHCISAPEVVLDACRALQAMTCGGDELAMQLRFESIMDEVYESMPTGDADECLDSRPLPVCDKILFEAVGIFAHSLIRIHCRCKRVVEVSEGLETQVVQEQQPT